MGQVNIELQPGETLLPAVAHGQEGADLILDPERIRRTILPGGIRVITEQMPGAIGVSLGAWVPRGSRHESAAGQGATHFLEHLLFKGTQRRSARQIAETFDEIGGESNAATAKEHTHYYARVLGQDLPQALECVLDMVTGARLEAADFELERGVILDELAMALDDPSERVHDAFAAELFGDHPLGRPVGGTSETVSAIDLPSIHEHYQLGYTPDQLVIAAAGDLRHEEVCELVSTCLRRLDSPWPAWREPLLEARPARAVPAPPDEGDEALGARMAGGGVQRGVKKLKISAPFEQTHLILGGFGLPNGHPQRAVATVLETILGGGMSSRLFQEIREERGLAYNTYTFTVSYQRSGQVGLAAACAARNAAEVSELLHLQLQRLAEQTVEDGELARAKGQLRGSILLGMDDTTTRMTRLGIAEVSLGKFIPLSLTMDRIEQVSAQDVRDLAHQWLEACNIEVWLGAV